MGDHQNSGGGAVLLLLLIIVVLGAAAYVYFKTDVVDDFKLRVTDTVKVKSEPAEVKDPGWCIAQTYNPGADVEEPVKSSVVGWDVEECCVKEVQGHSCALQRSVTVRYCYTASVGGTIKWVTVDGYNAMSEHYYEFVEHVDKEFIPNKVCSTEHYPQELRSTGEVI